MVSKVARLVRLIGAAGAVVESLNPAVLRPIDPFRRVQLVIATSDDFPAAARAGFAAKPSWSPMPRAAAGTPTFASLAEGPQVARRRGRRGEAAIRAMAVAVTMPRRVVDVAFHYVTTGPGGQPAPAGVRTQRVPKPADEDQWLAHMNRIYERQANIHFARAGPGRVVGSNGVQGPDVDTTGGPADDTAKIFGTPNAHQTARFRVFFVGRIGSFTMTHGAVTEIGGPNCVCQDGLRTIDRFGTLEALTTDVLKVAQVLAHEAGHAFGEVDDGSDKTLLMSAVAAGGEHIRARHGGQQEIRDPLGRRRSDRRRELEVAFVSRVRELASGTTRGAFAATALVVCGDPIATNAAPTRSPMA